MKRLSALLVATALTCGVALAQDAPLAPTGATVMGKLQSTLDSGKLHDGDTFQLVTQDTFFHKTALKGDIIDGHVENVVPAGPTHKAAMNVIFDDVRTPDGAIHPIDAHVTSMGTFKPHSHLMRDTALVIGGAVAGHIVSKKTGHGGGTFAGAAAGFALASSLKSNIVVKRGTIIELKLVRPVTMQAAS
jgi:hypothetical protein